MSAATRSAARDTASTRTSRAQARSSAKMIDVENVKIGVGASSAAFCDENVGVCQKRKTKSVRKLREDAENSPRKPQHESPRAAEAAAPASSASLMRPPLSPSKSASIVQRPLSPTKRHNGNPVNSGFSPPKMMKNENLPSPRKAFLSPIRAGPPQSPIKAGPPQSPIRAGPPQSPIRAGPPQSPKLRAESPSLTPRSLFSGRSKPTSSSSPATSKLLRTSCHPSSPLKSPPAPRPANILGQIPTETTSPLKSPADVKRSHLFDHSNELNINAVVVPAEIQPTGAAASSAASSATPHRSPPATSVSSRVFYKEASSKVILSPKTPAAASTDSASPSKPTTSPAKPPPSKTTPSSPPAPAPLTPPPPTAPPSTPAAPLGSPTSPAESRLARLHLNAAPSPYAAARKAFHTATPTEQLKGREAERKEIVDFIEDHVKNAKSGALYVSGAPGTGKTATLNTIINDYKTTTKCITIYINCMSVRNSSLIYAKILSEGSGSKASTPKGGTKGAQKAVEKLVLTKGKPILLFLDEMDQLGDANNQDVLYTLFEWTFVPGSRLVMVGVANALDLTERILPRLQAKAQRKPRTMNFAPYSQVQLMDILSHRLASSSPAPSSADSSPAPPALVDKSALIFCSKKIAAVSGDARKALDACRYAIEMVEKSSAESTPSATPFSTPHSTPTSGSATPSSIPPKKVGITHVMRVLSGVYENAAVATSSAAKTPNSGAVSSSNGGGGTLTLQQKIIICCLVLIHKKGKNTKVVTVGKLQDVYKKVCQRKGFIPGMSEAGGSDQAEFLSILSNIEASGILTIKKEKISRDSKVNLLLDEKELEKALQDDRKMLATILQSDII